MCAPGADEGAGGVEAGGAEAGGAVGAGGSPGVHAAEAALNARSSGTRPENDGVSLANIGSIVVIAIGVGQRFELDEPKVAAGTLSPCLDSERMMGPCHTKG